MDNHTTTEPTNETPPAIELRFAHGNLSKGNPDSLGLLQAWINDGFKIVTESHSGEYLYIRLERDNVAIAAKAAAVAREVLDEEERIQRSLEYVEWLRGTQPKVAPVDTQQTTLIQELIEMIAPYQRQLRLSGAWHIRDGVKAMAEKLAKFENVRTENEWLRDTVRDLIEAVAQADDTDNARTDLDWIKSKLDQFEKGEMP